MGEGHFTSRVERELSAGHSNGPPEGKCFRFHGHDFGIVVEITYGESMLDQYGWGPDFSKIKAVLDTFGDHQPLNEVMAPIPASAENIAKWLFDAIYSVTRFLPDFVSVSEGHGNKVTYYG